MVVREENASMGPTAGPESGRRGFYRETRLLGRAEVSWKVRPFVSAPRPIPYI
jgi:hypothetical protein